MLKLFLSFAGGAVVGGGAAWFFTKEKYRKYYEDEVEAMHQYYEDQNKAEDFREEYDADFYNPNGDQKPPKPEKRQGSFATDYTSFYLEEPDPDADNVDPAEKESPEEDMPAERNKRLPKLIKYEDFGEDGFAQVTLYYYTDDEELVGEGETQADIIDEDEVKDLIGDALTKYGFTDEYSEERTIYVRNFNRKTDYEIIKVRGSLEDGG